MTRAALHLNDAGLVLLDGDRVRYRQPGFALIDDVGLVTGNAAYAAARISPRRIQHRYWSALATEPLVERQFARLSAADLASSQLETLWREAGEGIDEMVIAVPPWMQQNALGLLLGIAADAGLPVNALVDSAVAATRREYANGVPVHIDIGLHHTMLTRLSQQGQAQVETAAILDDCGVVVLYDAWLRAVAEAFVRQSRFDPLHTAETEQMLLNGLGGWLAEAARGDSVALAIDAGGMTHRAEIDSLAVVGAVAPWYQQIANKLRALNRADEWPAIQLTDRVARLPGLAEMLTARVGGEVYVLEPGATARGALARCRAAPGAGGITLTRTLPWDQAAVQLAPADTAARAHGVPTHVLFGDVAWHISTETLELGATDDGGGRHIALRDDMPGVSRRHCTLRRADGQCVVEDHSRYGTFLNGHRINGSAVLQVGDALRIGTPGFEFQLITTDESHGA